MTTVGTSSSSSSRVDLRKYPNRRYYDATQSRHVTLDEIYRMIRSGVDVHVTDSKTGEDITAKVLAQIILEHDPPKLQIFPVELLHQLIRANEPLIRDFVDKYFTHALQAFLDSQRQFDRYLRQVLGLTVPLPAGHEWARMMMGPFIPALFPFNGEADTEGHPASPVLPATSVSMAESDLQEQMDQLREQVTFLQEELSRYRSSSEELSD